MGLAVLVRTSGGSRQAHAPRSPDDRGTRRFDCGRVLEAGAEFVLLRRGCVLRGRSLSRVVGLCSLTAIAVAVAAAFLFPGPITAVSGW